MRKIGEKMISDFLSSGEEIGQAAQLPRWSATHTITHTRTQGFTHTHLSTLTTTLCQYFNVESYEQGLAAVIMR